MKVHLNITGKLTFILVLFSAVLLAGVGVLAYTSGQADLQQAATSELLTRALEKQAALDQWITMARTDIATQAGSPVVAELAAALLEAAPGSPQAQAARDRLVSEFQPHVGPANEFTDLYFLEAESGQALAATEPGEEGKFKENMSFFINGKNAPYVSEMYYSVTLGRPAMTASAPVVAADGRLLGVLAGHLDLDIMNTLISLRSGLRQTDDAYLLNITGLLVTQPRFASTTILQPFLKTEAAKRCLEGNSGVISADDYRGIPAIISYRWLPERQMCLIVTIDQAEAYAPSLAFGRTIVLTGGLALALSVALAVALARTFTRPLLALQAAAARLGQGDLEYRVAVKSQDEIGRLTAAINEMAVNLQSSLGETAHGRRLLVALSQAAQAVQRARTPDEVYRAVGDQVLGLGFQATIATLTDDRAHLAFSYLTFKPALVRAGEKLMGFSVRDFRLPLLPGGLYQQVITEGETIFSESSVEFMTEALPGSLRPLAGRLAILLGLEEAIYAPLTVGGERYGLLTVIGAGLTEADVPAVTTFANQTAIALENVRATSALRLQSEIAANMSEGVYLARASDVVIVYANPKFEEMFGYAPGEMVGKHASVVNAPAEKNPEETAREIIESLNKQGYWQGEVNNVKKDGTPFWCYANVSTFDHAEYGRVWVSVHTDITERKRAEQAMERRVAELSALNAMATIVNQSLNVDEILNRAIDNALRLVGVEVAAMLLLDEEAGELALVTQRGLSDEFVRAFSRMKLGEGLAGRAAQTGEPAVLERLADYPGALKAYVEKERVQSAAVVPLLGSTGVIGVMNLAADSPQYFDPAGLELLVALGQQIAIGVEKARLYEAVRESEEKYRNLTENMSELVYRADPNTLVATYVNKAVKVIYGYTAKEWLGDPTLWESTIHPDDRERVLAEFTKAQRNLASANLEYRIIRKDKTVRWVEDRASWEKDKRGSGLALNGLLHDVTERVQAEEQLAVYTAQLERSNRDLQEFAYVASHDLQEPLRKVQAFSDRLASKYGDALDETGRDYLKRMQDASQRMQILINDLLGFSRVSTLAQSFTKVDLNTLAQEVLSDLENHIERTKARVEIGELPTIEADPTQMHQLLQNLIGNALKFHQDDIPLIIKVSAQIKDKQCQIAVQDNGIGFDTQYLDRIFKPFQRLHNREEYEGSGMGLAICRRIVERHGGSITATSAPGKGATFLVTLPIHQLQGESIHV